MMRGLRSRVCKATQFVLCLVFVLGVVSCGSIDSQQYRAVYKGRVVRVVDGDTLILDTGKDDVRVRLARIDAPEKRQEYGSESTEQLEGMVLGCKVKVGVVTVDRYQRTVGEIYRGKTNVNEAMVRQGAAWHYEKYDRGGELADVQDTAMRNEVGLWSIDEPIAPWVYRQ